MLAAPALAAGPGWWITKIALSGESAPGTASTFSDFGVAREDAGDVGISAFLSGPKWAMYRSADGSLTPIALPGESAPGTGGGSYGQVIGNAISDGQGGVSFLSTVTGGSGNRGLFFDDGSGDVALVVANQAAPGGGTFTPTTGDLSFHGMNAGGDFVFRSAVTGGTAASGIFLGSVGSGTFTVVEWLGAAAPGSGNWSAFGNPHIGGSGHVAFSADLSGGSAPRGLFRHVGGATSTLALEGDAAPGTGGGVFANGFYYPAVNDSGAVAFLSEVSGGSSAGGYFLHDGSSLSALVVAGQAIPDTGGASVYGGSSLPTLNAAGSTALAVTLSGGTTAGAVIRRDGATGTISTVARLGDPAPEAGGATFTSFQFTGIDEYGQVVFNASLSDGRKGVFRARRAPEVPALAPFGGAGLVLLLAAAGAMAAARRSRSAT